MSIDWGTVFLIKKDILYERNLLSVKEKKVNKSVKGSLNKINVHSHNKIFFRHKKKWNSSIYINMLGTERN